MGNTMRKDVVVIGGGIAGLYAAYKLSSLGMSVALIENQPTLASGPSIRNGGKIHRGAFHGALIDDEDRAIFTAKKCIHGYEEIKKFAPEALELESMPDFAVIKNDLFAERAIHRWDEVGVVYKPTTYERFSTFVPGTEQNHCRHIFEVLEAPIHYRILYHKLLHFSEKNAVEVFLGSEFVPGNDNNGIIRHEGSPDVQVVARYFLYTTGYGSKELINTYFPDKVKIRLWKSHALLFPRLSAHGFFFIEPGLPLLLPQTHCSVVCQSQEDTLVEHPDFSVDTAKALEVYNAFVNVMPGAKKYEKEYRAIACLKPDVYSDNAVARSVDVQLHELSRWHYLALPGKATEVPYMVDAFVRKIFDTFADERIAERPGSLLFKKKG